MGADDSKKGSEAKLKISQGDTLLLYMQTCLKHFKGRWPCSILITHTNCPFPQSLLFSAQHIVFVKMRSTVKLKAINEIRPCQYHIVFQNSQSLRNIRQTPVTCTKCSWLLLKLVCFSRSVERFEIRSWIMNGMSFPNLGSKQWGNGHWSTVVRVNGKNKQWKAFSSSQYSSQTF